MTDAAKQAANAMRLYSADLLGERCTVAPRSRQAPGCGRDPRLRQERQMTAMDDIERITRRLKRMKIQQPGPGEYVDQCHWSKTGWAIWRIGGSCSCIPAKAPPSAKGDK
jgi:hypothetical protein